MVKALFENGRKLLYSKQANILSAAVIIMIMVAASRVLGLIRYRTFVHFFPPEQLDTFLAAFQLPDMIFEILILGAMSSAFIPVFTKYLAKGEDKEAWNVAGMTLNAMFLFFLIFSAVIFVFAHPIYSIIAKGFTPEQITQTVSFTRILLIAQMFFIASYHLTAVLESNQRFLISSFAPLFYNLGIIVSTYFLAPTLGLFAPVLGVVIGSAMHLLIQLPLALSLGFKPIFSLNFANPGVRSIMKLALPRIVELSFLQIKRFTDLFIASLVVGGLTYFKFGDSLAALPVGLFGLSIAKASFPQLSRLASTKDMEGFKVMFASSFREILFLVLPISVFLTVLRVPIVRLAFGADQFDWLDTVQTGYVLSAFTIGAVSYALSLLISRAFYALQDTTTPVKVSILNILLNSGFGALFILVFKLPIWGLALSYSVAGTVQLIILFVLLGKKVGGLGKLGIGGTLSKVFVAASSSGASMFILLKILDRSVWDKKLSFLGQIGLGLPTTFDKFVLDTRYTLNLILITAFVAFVGAAIYLLISYLLKVEELNLIIKAFKKLSLSRFMQGPKAEPELKEAEIVATQPTNGV
ncbi:MAG: murein biosynthesis integral membrane protein MurJ [Candidatus Blackburnbacteria bacterium RIFCSPHIGHO2_02_FULL_39_13]|uniref:Probable lipid II flippase MurJ n=1 Tax=Candidatus Blackburnbacteria bacterium RIFCSPLOWO2_01_FULL_40_20 TaxID=1797519 RepID=A0A1G1VBI6_9BACT|nr:MAG: murein biosynthesis integral membrane protein MurJ [Candidatus Blackburnbacteria bacterium RIFCSPHIGHO2_01_FULL_40_17]OGY08452.1 MAG: murein biosynthesis integral membrane protein MurJ [Candidatus Blackburnbacteria bacterium RIFCSPHIGHO2_02_FULL_39_13]OGY12627.1 MAG: murein biosynthesis integral membrane protein MurJ [Candidatus Blackburnbacteria bacterium RIFCSPLOWO2_01_FULL_40_20]OGY14914.1 MAG: murein biosynthesis integral membrane protein MurJ [Candidatus Blackburnbacteria bacterium 